jgi:adenylate kinase family enzyme
MVTLHELSPRICIIGPSNSGKSTLANAIGQASGLVPIHLDQLHHYPHTDWLPRPAVEFIALHDKAIAESEWVMEGNYLRCLPQRLARATGIILLDTPTGTSLYRYLRRTWFERVRYGQLVGSRQRVTWAMIRHLVMTTRKNRRRYEALFPHWNLPKIRLATTQELASFYRREGLRR